MFDDGDGLGVAVLADATPGPALAAQLAGIDPVAVNGHARVVVMQAWERQASSASARMYEAIACVARSPMCMPDAPPELTEHFTEFASDEIGAADSVAGVGRSRTLACLPADGAAATLQGCVAGRSDYRGQGAGYRRRDRVPVR